MLNLQESAGNYVDDVTDPSLLYSAGGVAVASILGIGMTIVPFYKLPAGNVIRTGTLLGLGAYVFKPFPYGTWCTRRSIPNGRWTTIHRWRNPSSRIRIQRF